MIDCPGIIISDESEAQKVIKNIIKVEDVEDPIPAIDLILQKVNKEELLKAYKIADF